MKNFKYFLTVLILTISNTLFCIEYPECKIFEEFNCQKIYTRLIDYRDFDKELDAILLLLDKSKNKKDKKILKINLEIKLSALQLMCDKKIQWTKTHSQHYENPEKIIEDYLLMLDAIDLIRIKYSLK